MEQDKFKLASKNIALETKNFITKVDRGFFRLHRLESIIPFLGAWSNVELDTERRAPLHFLSVYKFATYSVHFRPLWAIDAICIQDVSELIFEKNISKQITISQEKGDTVDPTSLKKIRRSLWTAPPQHSPIL